jgi:hypothetical protein
MCYATDLGGQQLPFFEAGKILQEIGAPLVREALQADAPVPAFSRR